MQGLPRKPDSHQACHEPAEELAVLPQCFHNVVGKKTKQMTELTSTFEARSQCTPSAGAEMRAECHQTEASERVVTI
jgi:hypothetical protein